MLLNEFYISEWVERHAWFYRPSTGEIVDVPTDLDATHAMTVKMDPERFGVDPERAAAINLRNRGAQQESPNTEMLRLAFEQGWVRCVGRGFTLFVHGPDIDSIRKTMKRFRKPYTEFCVDVGAEASWDDSFKLNDPRDIAKFLTGGEPAVVAEDVHQDLDRQQEARRIADAFAKWLYGRNEETPLKEIKGVRYYEIHNGRNTCPAYVVGASAFLPDDTDYYDLNIGFTGPVPGSLARMSTGMLGGYPIYFVTISMRNYQYPDDVDVIFSVKWDMLIHEIIHYLDRKRAKGRPKGIGSQNPDTYYNSPLEFNAYFQQGLYGILNEVKRMTPDDLAHYFSTYELFRARFRMNFEQPFRQAMSEETRKRFDKRLYGLYVHLKDTFDKTGRVGLNDEQTEQLAEDYVDDHIDRQYRDEVMKHWADASKMDRRPTVRNWPPTAQELREIERAVLQDPEWLAYYARFGWTSFTQIRDEQWRWDADRKAFWFQDVPMLGYMPKAMRKHKGWSHPEGGLTQPDRTLVWCTLDGKLTRNRNEYSHLSVILPIAADQIKRFVARKAPTIRANIPYLQGRYYIRFGKWPENERSQIFRQGWDKVEPQFEKGVSAYHAYFDVHELRWAIDETMDYDTITGTVSSLYYGNREIYLVQGNELKTVGADGEPLLHNVRIVKELDKYDVYLPGIMDHREDDED